MTHCSGSSAAPELTDEEKREILLREDFHKFLNRTIRFVERAMHEEDIFVDYTGETDDDHSK